MLDGERNAQGDLFPGAFLWAGLGISLLICFISKVNLFWLLCNRFGTYPGDVWYMYERYCQFFENHSYFTMEYPVGIFALVKLSYLMTRGIFSPSFSYPEFMLVSSLLLAFFAFGSLRIILRLITTFFSTERDLYTRLLIFFIFSPTMIHLALHNYDLPGIFFMLLSLDCFLRRKEALSSIYLAVGTAIKLFPGLLLPLLLLRRRERASTISVVFLSTWLAINVPAMIANFRSWVYPYLWQAHRKPEPWDGLGYWSHAYLGGVGSLLLFALFYLAALLLFHRTTRSSGQGDSPREFLMQAALLMGIFFMFNKIYSPQYMLWLLPFFVFVPRLSLPLFWLLDLGNIAVNFFHFRLVQPHSIWANVALVVVRTLLLSHILVSNNLPLLKMGLRMKEKPHLPPSR